MGTGELLEIKKLQHNLSSLRKLAGWTAEDLGRKVGVTKQTVSNLENCRTSMSKIQYIAIRTILDYEARSNQNLARALHLVLDDRDATIEEIGRRLVVALKQTPAANNAAAMIFETTSIFSGTAFSFLKSSFQPMSASRLIKNSRSITSSMIPPYSIEAIHVGASKCFEAS